MVCMRRMGAPMDRNKSLWISKENVGMLQGKTAFVTGSTSGIGLGIAKALAEQGASIIINGLPQEDGDEIAAEVAKEFDVRAVSACADLTQEGAAETLVSKAVTDAGPIDILVNNAGIQFVAPLEEFPPEKWSAILALNLSARLSYDEAGGEAHERQTLGPDYQYCLGTWPGRFALQGGLCRRQAWACRTDQSHGPGSGRRRRDV